MKRNTKITVLLLLCCLFFQYCSKQNIVEPIVFAETEPIIGSESYYEALRTYKKSDHAICFGWWGASGSTGIGPDMAARYLGLPDSMDVISLWGGRPQDDANWEELRYCQRVKGTRFVDVVFSHNALMGDLPRTPEGIKMLARQIADTVNYYGLDGFDIDHEPYLSGDFENWNFFGDPANMTLFLKELSVYFGPKSGTGKLLIVDGEIYRLEAEAFPYLDYLVAQSYNTTQASNLQSRFNQIAQWCPPQKFVVTENMQEFGPSGTTYNYAGVNIGSVLGMAIWNPTQGRKGGFGGYIIESDAKSRPPESYYYLRRGIQIQNPAVY